MLSIDSKLWRVRSYNDGYAHITQVSTGVIRTIPRSKLPRADTLAAYSEGVFDACMRNAFHAAATVRGYAD